MKISAEFENGICKLLLTPDDQWEQELLGAVAKGGDKLDAIVTYRPEGHFTYNKCRTVQIQLVASRIAAENGL